MDCPLCLSYESRHYLQKEEPHVGVRDYFKCQNCDLVFLSPSHQLPYHEERQRYDTHQNSPEDQDYLDFLNRLILPLLSHLKPGSKGLDFGCGPGPAVQYLLGKEGFSVGNYDPIYFPDKALLEKQYDFVTATEVVEHLREPRATFQLLKTLIKSKTGHLGIMTQILNPSTNFESWWYHKDPTHICFYSKKTFDWIAQWMGWKADFPTSNIVIYGV